MPALRLSDLDQALLGGERGEAAALAMRTLVQLANWHGTNQFLDVQSAHVASAYDNTAVNLDWARHLAGLGAKVAVPTTLTSCAFDTRATEPGAGERQHQLIELHRAMGCRPALTCAPYLGDLAVESGDVLAWCESSAIVYANSVVGAYCNRFPEFLDLCAALTGRVPAFGLALREHRHARSLFQLRDVPEHWLQDTWIFEALGMLVGQRCGRRIPAIEGLPQQTTERQLCALGAAAAAAGTVDLFHAIGITPEAPDRTSAFGGRAPETEVIVGPADLRRAAQSLNRRRGRTFNTVCLGTPHAWPEDGHRLLSLLSGRPVHPGIRCYLAASQAVIAAWQAGGELEALQAAGVRLVSGRCTYYAPTLPGCDGHVVTTSAKWAWYARKHLDADITFLGLAEAVEAACQGRLP